jgi:glycopeptide antibiotics resistance protein
MSGPRRVLLIALFAVYLVLLVWLVLWKVHVPFVGRDDMREIKLVPFAASGGYGASSPFEVLANLLVFLPFGVYLRIVAPSWPLWRVVAVIAGASLALEVAQYAFATGSSDMTDVLVNTVGGLAGIGLLAAARRRLRSRAVPLVVGVCLAGTVAALVVVTIFVTHLPQIGPTPVVL